MKILEGAFQSPKGKIGIIQSRFNHRITDQLLSGALDALGRHGVEENQITLVKVPGAWEIPLAGKLLAESGGFAGLIALGAVIRGETPHFDYVCAEAAKGVAQVGLDAGIPFVFGVLTTNSPEEARMRSGVKGGNKGFEAAMTLLEMTSLCPLLGEGA